MCVYLIRMAASFLGSTQPPPASPVGGYGSHSRSTPRLVTLNVPSSFSPQRPIDRRQATGQSLVS